MPAVLVTDSTASLPADVAAARGIVVVPLQVVIGDQVYDEGVPGGATPAMVAAALRDRQPVSTSRPGPTAMAEVYQQVAAGGASEIVAVHLSAQMSGTYESAVLAARDAPVPVTVVDSRQAGIATGFAALAAADVLAAGGDALAAGEAARRRALATTSLFYVDTLDYLRRGGRVGAAAAVVGTALSVKPLLQITEGTISVLEKVRTTGRALARLEELAVQAAGDVAVDVGVAHLASPERADELVAALSSRLRTNLAGRAVWCGEVGAVLGAHVGPGMLAVCVAPRTVNQA